MRIVEAVLGLEAVAEALQQDAVGALVRPGLDRSLAQHVRPHVVDAVDLVGMLVGPDHGVDPFDLGVQKLGAQIGRGVDQNGLAPVLDQDGAAPRGGCADRRGWPPPTRPCRPSRRASARRPTCRSPGSSPARWRAPPWRTAGRNCRWSPPRARPGRSPLSSATLAAVWATKAGSLVLPRFGTGAR